MKVNPYTLTRVSQGAIDCDENQLDLFDYYDQPITPWQPSKKFESYDSKVKCILDIETTGLNALRERITYIGLKYVCEEKNFEKNIIIHNRESERQLLLDFIEQFERATPHILITHNGFLFDIIFIIQRLKFLKINSKFYLSPKTTTVTSSSHNGKPISFYSAYYKGVDIVDTYVLAGIYDKSANTLPNLRLKDLAIHFGIRDERRLELSYQEMMACWESSDDDTMIKYLEYDLEDTYELSKKLVPVYWAQYQLVPDISFQYCCIASPALKWQKLAESIIPRSGFDEADEKLKYKGAITGVNPGLYLDAYKLDVSSMYPSIILTYGLCGLKDKNNFLLGVMNYLMNERLRLKKLYQETGDENYNNMQNAMKILINGGYGFFGTGGYGYNCMATAALITAYGRAIVKLMAVILEKWNVKIVEIDTDGIICQGGDPQEILEVVQSRLPKGILIDLDWQHTDVYAPKAKNYILFHDNGKVVKKGIYKKRNKCKLEQYFPFEILEIFLKNEDKNAAFKLANTHLNQTLDDITSRNIDLEDIKVTKKIPNYKVPTNNRLVTACLGGYGDKVTYYEGEEKRFHKTSGKQLVSKPKPVQQGDYFVEFYTEMIEDIYYEMIAIIFDDFTLVPYLVFKRLAKKPMIKELLKKLNKKPSDKFDYSVIEISNIQKNLGDVAQYRELISS